MVKYEIEFAKSVRKVRMIMISGSKKMTLISTAFCLLVLSITGHINGCSQPIGSGTPEPTYNNEDAGKWECTVDSFVDNCESLFIVWINDVSEVARNYGECENDDECISIASRLNCPSGPRLGTCNVTINSEHEGDFREKFELMAKEYCNCADSSCLTTASCLGPELKCRDSICQ